MTDIGLVGPPRTSREGEPARRGGPLPGAREARRCGARGETSSSGVQLSQDPALERELIAADEHAPRGDSATLCAARHPGHNEDRVLCDPVRGVAAVFDGIGGEAGGELAARAACGAMAMALDHLPPHEDLEGRRRWLETAVRSGQDAIALSKRMHPECADQGTTAMVAVLSAHGVLTTCVGDSRAYHVRGGTLELIADEHEDMTPRPAIADALDRVSCVEDFEGAPKDLRWAFTYRHIISAELGSDTVHATVREHEVEPGDLILVISDGVHDNLTHQEMQALVADPAGREPLTLSTALVARAQERSQDPGHLRSKDDDVSCAVLRAT